MTILPEPSLAHVQAGPEGRLRLRVACNRDELITRAPALPPVTLRIDSRSAVMPIDPESGGTWIAANDAGLVFVLLNAHDGWKVSPRPRSRGTIIPELLGCGGIEDALRRARALRAGQYRPFRLLVMDARTLMECWPDGDALAHDCHTLAAPSMRTSSSLGDDLVAGPRASLFRQFLDTAHDPVAAEDLFHLHQWRGREEVSVRMRRHDARTVSHTVVEIRDRSVSLAYRPAAAPDRVSVTVAA